jgi:hypothetical protein
MCSLREPLCMTIKCITCYQEINTVLQQTAPSLWRNFKTWQSQARHAWLMATTLSVNQVYDEFFVSRAGVCTPDDGSWV